MPHASALSLSAGLLLSLLSSAVMAGTVTVVTSFPKELTQAYKSAFEKANPSIKIEVLNKNTVQGIAYVRELPVGQRPDIFWASAPDAFEVLAGQKLLENIADLANKSAPAKVGNYPAGCSRSTARRSTQFAGRVDWTHRAGLAGRRL